MILEDLICIGNLQCKIIGISNKIWLWDLVLVYFDQRGLPSLVVSLEQGGQGQVNKHYTH